MRPTHALVTVLVLISACATVPDRPGAPRLDVAPLGAAEARAVAPAASGPATTAPRAVIGGDEYTRASLGWFTPAGDIDGLDDGFWGQVAFGSKLIPLLDGEVSIGYLQAEGNAGQELWGVPLFVNGRLHFPILILEAYGGLGVGGMLTDYKLGGGFDDTEFLLAGNAFVGLEVGLAGFGVGLEYRYLITEEADPGFSVEGHAVMLTGRLSF